MIYHKINSAEIKEKLNKELLSLTNKFINNLLYIKFIIL
ncbi:hypothetical protein Calag_0091 [Caldisphaera lagunensis DSM 15908]|uniref:Uncharacterized protein n=1 Tax=Caldisphaera lagunensis (strain DSM 15908 / JCM 11604 / ANMR 0165 / IC-154) TaxID=1056495 RepID=L0A8Y0_CALLD|nr:hypothetical protein Calag_0091 [Caldisphaera lagunensis DSM 15908]